MKYNFTFRLFRDTVNSPVLSGIDNITISGITLISKPTKFSDICFHKANQKKYGYTIELSKKFNNISGSHSTPSLTFKGQYIDIIIKDFPYYPAFYQAPHAARNCLNGYGYTNEINNGFVCWEKFRKYEFINN